MQQQKAIVPLATEDDRASRWTPGERFHDVLLASIAADPARAVAPAVETDAGVLTFADLVAWTDAVAAELADAVRAGDRVALLFDRSPQAWVAMLALSKLGAAWVPLDPSFPEDRIAFIAGDADVRLGIASRDLAGRLAGAGLVARTVPDFDPEQPTALFTARATADEVAYVIYTSGTTGRPKGVPIEHGSICNFLRVAAACYGYRPGDRVYQGLTIAFDFSIEEIWVPLIAGATLVPAPDGVPLVGVELTEFLLRRRITALCCVPTLLASIDADLPALRLLLVSGESCPQQLVRRWAVDGRRMVNLYGPTETTVTATWAVLAPDDAVTIGLPLPTYRAFVIDPASGLPVGAGEQGELVIAGPGVAPGYLGRPELTAKAFIPDPDGVDGHRAYRTGDLVRTDEHGRFVYLGRIDTQIKIRGYRIELDEIESVLLALDGVAQAAVTVVRRPGGADALAGYFTAVDEPAPEPAALLDALRTRLPAYMVPATLDRIGTMPMLPSQKVDRRALPAPRRPAARRPQSPVSDPREALIASAIADVLELDAVDPEADLFADLGADSFSIARLCAALREQGLDATTRLVYGNPSARAIAAALPRDADEPARAAAAGPVDPGARASRTAWVLTGAAQAAVLLGALAAIAFLIDRADDLIDAAPFGLAAYGTACGITAAVALLCAGVPIAAKWLLIGRWTERRIPAWSAAYLRFWIVRTSLRLSPMRLLVGSPLYSLYLRALGARIGRHALVLSDGIPVCADLIEIGENAVVAPKVKLDGYRVRAGFVETGPVSIGADAVVGYGSHLDVRTAIGRASTLAHASALLEGQRVPDGRAWHGSPAVDAGDVLDAPPAPRIGTAPRVRYTVLQLAALLGVTGPLTIGVAVWADDIDVFDPLQAAWFAVLLLLAGWLVRAFVPRLLAMTLRPDREYGVYTGSWARLRTATAVANSPILNELFGDSSAIVFYLRSIGVRFRSILQTGSNLGTAQHFDLPSWCTIGGGTLISDGLAMPNAEFSTHSFRVRPIAIGDRVFMGNGVVYPPGAGVGDDVLLATKVMVPVDGVVRSGVGLLGSPAFEVPRTVRRDAAYGSLERTEDRRRDLARKNRHNTATGALFLLHRFAAGYVAIAIVGVLDTSGATDLLLALLAAVGAEVVLLAATDLLCRGFRRLQPLTCSLYDARFWRHERYWKISDPRLLAVLDGTPFKPLVWRLLGVRVGRMLLDDGATMPERSMVRIGDHVTLGAGCTLHGHSLEDGVFKSGAIRIDDGASIGPSALVHYGVEVGPGATVRPDAFVLKGEVIRTGETWVGNPAHPTRA
ncbi:Pls/PosA family non-ribosomal peptide synthetase [Amnibacterium kyonggiense]